MVTKDELRKKKVIHGKHGTYTFIPKDDIQWAYYLRSVIHVERYTVMMLTLNAVFVIVQ
jgi:hypothetical protein